MALLILPSGSWTVGVKANVPFVGWQKIELKKSAVGKNKKYRKVGNECRLTRCLFAIWSLCIWSPVNVYKYDAVLYLTRLSVGVVSSYHWLERLGH